MPLAAVLLAGALALGGLYVAVTPSQAQANKLFVVGQQYGVLYSCLAQIGCYGEVVTVREVRPDGWLVVTTEDGKRWTVNIDAILSFMPINAKAARDL